MVAARQLARIHSVMADQLERVNDRSRLPLQTLLAMIDERDDLIDALRQQINTLTARPPEIVQGSLQNKPARASITSQEAAARFRVSPATLNRALNGVGGNRVVSRSDPDGVGAYKEDGYHWRVYADAEFIRSSAKRGRKAKAA